LSAYVPDCSTGLEVKHFYTRAYDNGCLFVRGTAPTELAGIAKVSQRRWHQYERDLERESPILTGLRYLRLFEQESVTTYARAASILGVSRESVHWEPAHLHGSTGRPHTRRRYLMLVVILHDLSLAKPINRRILR